MSDIFKKLQEVDIRWIYLLTVIVLTLPVLNPVGLPMEIAPSTLEVYEQIEALPSGSKVIAEYGLGPGQMYEQGLGMLALLKHVVSLDNNIKLYILAFGPSGPLLFDTMHRAELEKVGLSQETYGEEWVLLPYVPGLESAVVAFAKDVHSVISDTDYYGNKIEDLPMMQEVNTIEDFDLVVESIGVSEIYLFVIRQWSTPYGLDCIIVSSGIGVPIVMPYYEQGVVNGMVRGLRGCAEYEILIKKPGDAVKNMDAMSFAHIELLLFIILANIGYWINKLRGSS